MVEQGLEGGDSSGAGQLEVPLSGVAARDTASDPCIFPTGVVYMLGYPAMGKRTIGSHLATLLDGVLVDNALINRPVLELFRWDGVGLLPQEIWDRTRPILDMVLATIEDLAPPSNSYVFTNVIEEGPEARSEYDRIRSLADRRGSLFLAVMLDCDIDVEVSRIDNPDRVALRKGSDPEGYRGYRLHTRLYQSPEDDVLHLDTTTTSAPVNAARILGELARLGLQGKGQRALSPHGRLAERLAPLAETESGPDHRTKPNRHIISLWVEQGTGRLRSPDDGYTLEFIRNMPRTASSSTAAISQ